MKNTSGDRMPMLKDIVNDSETRGCIIAMLGNVFGYIGISNKRKEEIINSVLDFAGKYEQDEYEKNVHMLLAREKVLNKIPKKLANRAEAVFKQIRKYIKGDIVDIGCGDGRIGEMIAKNPEYSVKLCDVYKHSHIPETGLVFKSIKSSKIPFKEQFDTVLLLTVLHHSNSPTDTLKEAIKVTKQGGRIIVIESVYGVDGKLLSNKREQTKYFFKLSYEKQRLVNMFFDHFYNRCIHYNKNPSLKVNVPFNFKTPEQWKEFFEYHGLAQERIVHLGIDQPTVPEYHTMHVLRK